jgi:hypothetical protein
MVERILLNAYVYDRKKIAFKMSYWEEWWIMPQLKGKAWRVREANKVRYLYLKEINLKLKELIERDDIEEIIRIMKKALYIVENQVKPDYWLYRRKLYPDVIW